jgi:hypothetical protein
MRSLQIISLGLFDIKGLMHGNGIEWMSSLALNTKNYDEKK